MILHLLNSKSTIYHHHHRHDYHHDMLYLWVKWLIKMRQRKKKLIIKLYLSSSFIIIIMKRLTYWNHDNFGIKIISWRLISFSCSLKESRCHHEKQWASWNTTINFSIGRIKFSLFFLISKDVKIFIDIHHDNRWSQDGDLNFSSLVSW